MHESDGGAGFDEGLHAVRLSGAAISLQVHKQRAEHWVVLEGEAEVTLNGSIVQLSAHQSIDVPVGATHRLRNSGPSVLRVVEVQSGPYLGEDDIERVDR